MSVRSVSPPRARARARACARARVVHTAGAGVLACGRGTTRCEEEGETAGRKEGGNPEQEKCAAAQRSSMCLTVTARSRLMYLCPSSGVAPNAVVRKPSAATGHFIIHHLEVSTIERTRCSKRSEAVTLSDARSSPSQSLS